MIPSRLPLRIPDSSTVPLSQGILGPKTLGQVNFADTDLC